MNETQNEVVERVIAYANEHDAKKTWWGKTDAEWLVGLTEEYLELHLALDGEHEHSPEFELLQIASCAINFLRHLERQGKVIKKGEQDEPH